MVTELHTHESNSDSMGSIEMLSHAIRQIGLLLARLHNYLLFLVLKITTILYVLVVLWLFIVSILVFSY